MKSASGADDRRSARVPAGRDRATGSAKYGVLAAKLALTALVTWFVLRSVDAQLSEIRAIDWTSVPLDVLLLLASFAALFGELVLGGWVWRRLVKRLGGPFVPLHTAAAILILANFGRYVPGKVLNVVGVAILAKRALCPAPVATAASLYSQLMHLAAGVFVGGWAVLQLSGVTWGSVAAMGAVVLLILVGLTRSGPVRATLEWAVRKLHRRRRSEVEFDPRSVAGLAPLPWIAAFAGKWFVYGLAFFLLARSIGADASFLFCTTVFAGAYLAGYVAVFAPAGVGVREAAMIAMAEPTLGLEASVVLAVAQRAWITAFELIAAPGSVAALWRAKPSSRTQEGRAG